MVNEGDFKREHLPVRRYDIYETETIFIAYF